jgi:hypothetical protein
MYDNHNFSDRKMNAGRDEENIRIIATSFVQSAASYWWDTL